MKTNSVLVAVNVLTLASFTSFSFQYSVFSFHCESFTFSLRNWVTVHPQCSILLILKRASHICRRFVEFSFSHHDPVHNQKKLFRRWKWKYLNSFHKPLGCCTSEFLIFEASSQNFKFFFGSNFYFKLSRTSSHPIISENYTSHFYVFFSWNFPSSNFGSIMWRYSNKTPSEFCLGIL